MALKRSAEERRLLEKAARYLPGGSLGNVFGDAEHRFIVKEGRGSHLWDISDNEYIDYLLGSGPMVLGHAHPAVVKTVREALERGTTYFATNATAIELAEEISRAVPCAQNVRFTTSGTDATFQCLRLARAYRKRDKILKFEGGYHGSHDYAEMSVTPKELKPFPQAVPDTAGIPASVQQEVLIAPFNDIETATAIIQEHHEALAAVIVEPLQRIIPPRPGFLQGLRDVTAQYGIPLIFDEVVTGFRLAYGGAQEFYGVVPDLAAFGKIVGGGFPLAAICGKEEIMQCYDPRLEGTDSFVPQVGTLSGNPIAAAAGLATLQWIKANREANYQRLRATGKRLRQALEEALTQAEIPAQVTGDDTCFDVYFTDREIVDYRSTLGADKAMMKRFNNLLLDEGILKGGQKLYMSMVHSDEDVQRTIAAFGQVAETLRS